jgi:hypothetical protein
MNIFRALVVSSGVFAAMMLTIHMDWLFTMRDYQQFVLEGIAAWTLLYAAVLLAIPSTKA